MSKLVTELNKHGFDYTTVMQRFKDNEELYLNCFIGFMKDERFFLLGSSLRAKNYEEALSEVHTLKITASNLGLVFLCNTITVVENALLAKNYANIKIDYSKFMAEYQALKKIEY